MTDMKTFTDTELNKPIWEGWRVIDFINYMKPDFECHTDPYEKLSFETRDDIKKWCQDHQPYVKKYIPSVVTYFWEWYKDVMAAHKRIWKN